MESNLTNGLAFIFLSFSVLPDVTDDEKLLLKVDATETEPYLAMCRMRDYGLDGNGTRGNVELSLFR